MVPYCEMEFQAFSLATGPIASDLPVGDRMRSYEIWQLLPWLRAPQCGRQFLDCSPVILY